MCIGEPTWIHEKGEGVVEIKLEQTGTCILLYVRTCLAVGSSKTSSAAAAVAVCQVYAAAPVDAGIW